MNNDGGIKRGDRADTGDDQARKQDGVGPGGSGVPGGDGGSSGHVTGATDSLAESTSGVWSGNEDVVEAAEDVEDLYISDADDPGLGLTDIGEHPPEDWAADTGASQNANEGQNEVEAEPLEAAPSMQRKRKPKKSTN